MDSKEFLKALRPYRYLGGILGACIILNLVFYGAVTGSQRNEVDGLRHLYSQIRVLDTDRSDAKYQKYQEGSEAIEAFMDSLPVLNQLSERIDELNRILRRPAVALSRMTFEPAEDREQSLISYATKVTASGDYGNLKDMLADLQNSTSLFCIDSLSLRNRSDDTERVDMTLGISTYFRKS